MTPKPRPASWGPKIRCLLALGIAAALPLPAHAQTDPVVHTADLDLSSPEGRRVLDRRIRYAATRICTRASTPRTDHWPVCLQSAIKSGSAARDRILRRAEDGQPQTATQDIAFVRWVAVERPASAQGGDR